MKKTNFKRIVAMILSVTMLISLSSCGGLFYIRNPEFLEGVEEGYSEAMAEAMSEAITLPRATEDGEEDVTLVEQTDEISHENLRYVMIYNPKIYDEYAIYDTTSLKTGYLGSQIDVNAYRADGLENEEVKLYTVSQRDLMGDFRLNTEVSRGDFIPKIYKVGDKKDFYCFSTISLDIRTEKEFECVYVGEHCHIWTVGGIDNATLEEFGKEFDKNIFNQTIEEFGEPRFSGKTGKVNLLFSDLPGYTLGVFHPKDLYSKAEWSSAGLSPDNEKFNTDHDILYIDSDYAKTESFRRNMYSTMAHEFQHLICATNTIELSYGCHTWLNEAMSGYIEDYLYPGVQVEGKRYTQFNQSNLIRKGQSIYNFDTTNNDIGVYGSVYIFSKYLAKIAGLDIFTKMHEYWRDSLNEDVTEATAIDEVIPASEKTRIDNLITYPSSWEFYNSSEKFMSKLVLDFYLSILSNRDSIPEFENIEPEALLYDEINGAEIEGGGRIIVAVNESTFKIPDEADSGLIYVGLDENFEVVTPFAYS